MNESNLTPDQEPIPEPDPVPVPDDPTTPPEDGDLISALNLNVYRKAIIAFVIGAIAWVTQVANSDESGVTSSEWIALAGYLLATLGVYTIPNAIAAKKAATPPDA